MNTLPADLESAAATLERGAESVRTVMTGEPNRFGRALAALRALAEAEGVAIAIVGGLAAIHYGYPAATQDIDIAVGRNDLEKLLRAAPVHGFKVAWEAKSGWHTLMHDDVEINIVPEGGRARKSAPTLIPGPRQLGVDQGLGYASFAGWVELKLASGRQRDLAHVVETLKKGTPEVYQAARAYLATRDPGYVALFDRLHEQALVENEQENHDERDG